MSTKEVTLQLTTRPRRIKDFIPRAQNRPANPGLDAGGLIGGGTGSYGDYSGGPGGWGAGGVPVCLPTSKDLVIYNCAEPMETETHALGLGMMWTGDRDAIRDTEGLGGTPVLLFDNIVIEEANTGASNIQASKSTEFHHFVFHSPDSVIYHEGRTWYGFFDSDTCLTAVRFHGYMNAMGNGSWDNQNANLQFGIYTWNAASEAPPSWEPSGHKVATIQFSPQQYITEYDFTITRGDMNIWYDPYDGQPIMAIGLTMIDESFYGNTSFGNPGDTSGRAVPQMHYPDVDESTVWPLIHNGPYGLSEDFRSFAYTSEITNLAGLHPEVTEYFTGREDPVAPGSWGRSEWNPVYHWRDVQWQTWEVNQSGGYGKMASHASMSGITPFSRQWMYTPGYLPSAPPYDFTIKGRAIFPEVTPEADYAYFWISFFKLGTDHPTLGPLPSSDSDFLDIEILWDIGASSQWTIDDPTEGTYAYAFHDDTNSEAYFALTSGHAEFDDVRDIEFYARVRLDPDALRYKIWKVGDAEPDWQGEQTGLTFPNVNFDLLNIECAFRRTDETTVDWEFWIDEIVLNGVYRETFSRGQCIDGRLIREVYFDGLKAEPDQYSIVNNQVVPVNPLPEGTEVTIDIYPGVQE